MPSVRTLLGRFPLAGLALIAAAAGCASLSGDWRTASHEPVGSAPDPAIEREAVVQVYAARAFSWRGTFGVHTWVAVKPANVAVRRSAHADALGSRGIRSGVHLSV